MRRSSALWLMVAVGLASCTSWLGAGTDAIAPTTTVSLINTTESAAPTTSSTVSSTTTTIPVREAGTVPGWTVGQAWGSVRGLTMFRGNPTRTYYGEPPVPTNPDVLWSYPAGDSLCSRSNVAGTSTVWCGTGWTGQPVVYERTDGVTEVIFGAYDKKVHFLDGSTGLPTRAPFVTGDLIKGSVSLDPDGFPLLYFGSRDNKLRIVALDRPEPDLLWDLDASAVRGIWNNDWDGNPVVLDDLLLEGGENSWFFIIKLNRGYDAAGFVTVQPERLIEVPGYTDDLISRVGSNVSIENSPAVFDNRVYFANSGGRIVGLDLSEIAAGQAPVVFDYWVGDDVDATITIDGEGMLYIAAELERFNERSAELGQLIKLDPYAADPFVWGVPVPPRGPGDGGLWATPALGDGVLYASTHPGELLAVDTETGQVLWRDEIGFHAWSSPVIVDKTLVVSVNCETGGGLRAYSLADPAEPQRLWQYDHASGCIESTPAVWKGTIFVGSRDGRFYAFGEK
ncbi:MAG: PQQ-binding-like beta-propeller repeat protein [Acidimicrobiia bacterium]|nr:PQQ-binding-like beta-propeller repeat protein [Acidimicrobiia bacterium]MDH3396674.1 PQQ-binding-like beta-propeller repeat protein [Acidimicrobiia bacterium]